MTPEEHTRTTLEKYFSQHKKIKVVFTKKDGTERTMICSRHAELLPEIKQGVAGQEKTTARPPSEFNFPIFDIENQKWKQFTIAKLISIEPCSEDIPEEEAA